MLRSRLTTTLLLFTGILTVSPSIAEEMQPPLPLTIDFEVQGCGRFPREAYYRTEFHFVNVCRGEANFQMVVTDADGLGRERLAVEKTGNGFVGTSDRGTRYEITPTQFTMQFQGQTPGVEKVTLVSTGSRNPAGALRYNCQSQVKSLPNKTNVPLPEAQQLVLLRNANQFVYRCMLSTESSAVTGVVTYRQRIALPPNAVVEVTLQDVSRADAPAIVLARQTITTEGKQVPIPFSLTYDDKQIDPRYTYSVQARILIDGQLRFISTRRYGVITQGQPKVVEVMVEPVGAATPR